MKKTLAITLLLLAIGQAQADGFYQQIVGDQPQSGQATGATTSFNYTPLYVQVMGKSRLNLNQDQKAVNTVSKTTYTPLYLKVTDSAG